MRNRSTAHCKGGWYKLVRCGMRTERKLFVLNGEPGGARIGPANAGKTTLLHQLDEKLKRQLDSVLMIKGNPDGTGRYLYHAPDLRNEADFKRSVKGKWGDATVDRICEWITHGRHNLSLALLDFGGRHDEQTAAGNARMLKACSHYLVVSRDTDRDADSLQASRRKAADV